MNETKRKKKYKIKSNLLSRGSFFLFLVGIVGWQSRIRLSLHVGGGFGWTTTGMHSATSSGIRRRRLVLAVLLEKLLLLWRIRRL